MPVTLQNTAPQPFVFDLYHEEFCRVGGPCECTKVTYPRAELAVEGSTRRYRETRLVPRTVTIPGSGRVNGLHEAVLQLSQVKHALGGRVPRLRAVVTKVEGPTPTAASAVESEVKTDERRRGRARRDQ